MTQFSRLIAQDRPCGVRDMGIAKSSIWVTITSSMIIDLAAMISVEFLRPLQGADHMCPGNMMTGAGTAVSRGSQPTQGSQGLMRGRSSFKAWTTGIEHTGKDSTETARLAAEFMSPDLSVSVELSEPLRFLPTLGWQRE